MDAQGAAPKKTRGRPKGTGTDDSQALARVADRLVAYPTMRASTAMRRDCPTIGITPLRRLQRKWKIEKDTLMAEANKRLQENKRREEAARRSAYNPAALNPDYGQVAHLLRIGKTPSVMLGYELANRHIVTGLPLAGAAQATPAWMSGVGALYPHAESPFAKQTEWLSKIARSHCFGAVGALHSPLAKHLEWPSKSTEALGIGVASRELEAILGNLDSIIGPVGIRRRRS